MSPKEKETFYQSIVQLTSKTMRLEARCDALEIACGLLAVKAGIPQDKMFQAIKQMTGASFQKRLERAESADPSIAADLDYRAVMPDLPDELL